MDIAVAEMAEGDDPRPGKARLDSFALALEEDRHLRNRYRDVMLQRGAVDLLGFRDRFAQRPKRLRLCFARRDRRVEHHAVLDRRRQPLFQPCDGIEAALRSDGLDQDIPGAGFTQRRAGARDRVDHHPQGIGGDQFETFNGCAGAFFEPA